MDRWIVFDIMYSHNPYGKVFPPLNRGKLDSVEDTPTRLMTTLNSLNLGTETPLNCSGRRVFIVRYLNSSKFFITIARRLFSTSSELKGLLLNSPFYWFHASSIMIFGRNTINTTMSSSCWQLSQTYCCSCEQIKLILARSKI